MSGSFSLAVREIADSGVTSNGLYCFEMKPARLMLVTAIVAASIVAFAIGLASGLAIDSDSRPGDVVVVNTPSPTSAVATSVPVPHAVLPKETADWDPCQEKGLCELVRAIDDALRTQDHEVLQQFVHWVEITCVPPPSGPGNEPARGANGILISQPFECWDWPYDEPIPSLYIGGANKGGAPPTARWGVQMLWRQLASPADRCYKTQVRAISLPSFEDGGRFIWLSEPLDCPYDSERTLGHALGVRRDDDGVWRIFLIVVVDTRQHLHDPGYAGKVRYYQSQ